MTAVVPPPGPPTPGGEALVTELRWIHDMIRRDLGTVLRLADEVTAGASADEISRGLASLAAQGPLWQLKINCLRHCRFVHSHHGIESASLFPALRAANPALGPVIDRLEADHRTVSDVLDAVEAEAAGLGGPDEPAVRGRLAAALRRLADELLPHLEYEEEHISGTLATFEGPTG
ncbi:hemerythrin domain-containing protein [Streptomyces sp. PT12]|uniref:hemerythrin domain-containing protein n=1 Tax=Streptomyces sp. PT12 TaxID=1510197 RepID=UPI0015EFAC71|nr:hemerythrin domain-containing protein [Streptomyces sp. PT12]